MKKTFLLVFSFMLTMFVGLSDLQAQTVTYTDSNGTTYTDVSVSSLVVSDATNAGTLATATEISLSGSWSADDLLTFKQAIKSSWNIDNDIENTVLTKVDMSAITALTGDFAGGAYDSPGFAFIFTNCSELKTVVMPAFNLSSAVSFADAFNGCSVLIGTLDLNAFTNISDLRNTFKKCNALNNVYLGTDPNGIIEENLVETFRSASTSCLKYLPSGVIIIPTIWQDYFSVGEYAYGNFVLPFTATVGDITALAPIKQGETLELPAPVISDRTPEYAAFDIIWQIASSPAFTTNVEVITSNTAISQSKSGYYLRYILTSPNGATYAASNALRITVGPYVMAYNQNVSTFYSVSELSTGTLASAESVSLYGDWNAENILALKQAIKSSWDANNISPNSTLKKVDMSGLTALTGDYTGTTGNSHGFAFAFRNCTALTTVVMPTVAPGGAVSFHSTFLNCTALLSVDLSVFDNILTMEKAFNSSNKLTTVTLPSSNLYAGGTSFEGTFQNCKELTSVDLSGFDKISVMGSAFQNCYQLTDLTLPDRNEHPGDVSFWSAFSSCRAITSIDLSGFSNIETLYDAFQNCYQLTTVTFSTSKLITYKVPFSYTFKGCSSLTTVDLSAFTQIGNLTESFSGCTSLSTVRLGVLTSNASVPNTFTNTPVSCLKYLSAGVTDIPTTWQNYFNAGQTVYGNFVIPFTATVGEITAPGVIEHGETLELTLPEVSAITPAYAAYDMVWQIAKDEDFTTNVEVITSSTPISQRKHLYYLRYALISPDGTAYATSNAVQIKVTQISVEAYVGGAVKWYSFSDLSDGTLADADSIALYGDLTAEDILAFKYAIKSEWCDQNSTINQTLKELDLRYITSLTGDFSGDSFDSPDFAFAFANCTALTKVMMPEVAPSGEVSFYRAFNNCTALTTIDLSKFTNITDLRDAFENCTSLDTIRLGADPNSISPDNLIETFHNTNVACIKFLPDGVVDIPQTWKDYYSAGNLSYGNFVIPFTITVETITAPAAIKNGATLELTVPTVSDITPAYAASESLWQIAKDEDFTTNVEVITSSTPISQSKSRYYLRYVLTSPNGATYATSNAVQITVGPYVIAYRSNVPMTYSVAELSVATLSDVESVYLYDDWSAENILAFKKSIKSRWNIYFNNEVNNRLTKVDMSGITALSGVFTGASASSYGFASAFYSCRALTTVIMPKVLPSSAISFYHTFYNCVSLTGTIDLGVFNSISDLEFAFYECKIQSIILPTNNIFAGATVFSDAFHGCTELTSVDLSGFSKISNMNAAFKFCSKLTNVALPAKNEYTEVISMFEVFNGCSALTTVNIGGFGMINDMFRAFSGCSKLSTLTLPATNRYVTTATLFSEAFSGCENLTTIDISGFANISKMIGTFDGCSRLDTVRLGVNPNNLISENLVTTFHNVPATCIKYLPVGVADIPQFWKDYHYASDTTYNNFVLALTVGNIATPTVLEGNCLSLIPPTITLPEKYSYTVDYSCSDLIWQIAKDANFTTYVETITSNTAIPYTKNGYYLRCGVERDLDGVMFWSNVVQIDALKIAYPGSYTLRVPIPVASTLEVKDEGGKNKALSYYTETRSEGSKTYYFTQGVPATTYSIYQDNVMIGTATMDPVPTYTPVSGTHSSAPAEDAVVSLGEKLTLETATTFNNLLTAVAADQTYKNKFGSLVNLEPITVSDGLVVNLDLTDCNDQWAYMSMPFDFDVSTGIRYQTAEDIAAGTETVAVPDTDFYLMRYDPAKRAVNGEGTKNWTDVTTGIIKTGEGFLIAKESANIYKILALTPNSLDAADKNIQLQLNEAAEDRTGWDTNWNFIGSPFASEYAYRPSGDAPKFLYRRNDGSWAGGYEINYDAIDKGETLHPYTPYLTQIWSNNTTLTLKVDGSSASLVAARAQEDRNAFALDLYKADTKIDKVGWIFTPESSKDIVINEDAIKAGIGLNSIWAPYASKNLVYNNMPFEGNRMNFGVSLKTEANSAVYKIKMRSATTEHHDIYIREANSDTWHDLSLSDYILPAATSTSTRSFEVSIAKNQVVTSTPTQEGSSVIVYSNRGNIFVDGVAYDDVVSIITTSGVKLAEYSNSIQHTISNLPLGSYLIRIQTNNGVLTKKVTTVVK